MQKINDTIRTSIARVDAEARGEVAEPAIARAIETTEPVQWHTEVGDLLAQAAILCVTHGVDVDTFMKGAWSAYVEARPGMRDYIEEMQLRTQLEELRKLGRLGEA